MSRHYPRAPISEAIIDIKAELPPQINKSSLARIHTKHKKEYPHRGETKIGRAEMKWGAEVSASATSDFLGFTFKSADNLRVFQARRDGFTLSRLAPYDSWEPFREEARTLWTEFRAKFKPASVRRLAVRYINRIELLLPIPELKNYFKTVPEVSDEFPCNKLAGFFMQLVFPQPDIKSTAIVNEATVEPVKEGHASIVLDIDIYRDQDVPQEEAAIWEFFETLRNRKNDVFESCITDETRRFFE